MSYSTQHSRVPPLTTPIGFNAQHSPAGAFLSFTCGHFGTRGGLAAELGRPASQDLFVGVKDGDRFGRAPLRCLPFFADAAGERTHGDEFLVEQAGPAEGNATPDVTPFAEGDIARHYGWATDAWRAGGLGFTVHTPFGPIPDPADASINALREALSPSVTAELTVDNRDGKATKTAVFAVHFPGGGVRTFRLGGGETPRCAFVERGRLGFAATLAEGGGVLVPFQRWNASVGLSDPNPVHQLGNCAGVGVEVPAGEVAVVRLALGCYLPGLVTTGVEASYFYTRCFTSLADVLGDALDGFDRRAARAAALDAELLDSDLSADQQFLVAHATRSYYGSTQLLDAAGGPLWVVNEGEYCMMNTLDLSVDQAFWELDQNPWVVRNLLDGFVQRYSFVDDVKVYADGPASAGGRLDAGATHDPSQPAPPPDEGQLNRPFSLSPGGLSFTHDMGVHNNFSPAGTSSYELADLTGCFSHMTQEQLCNWVLIAGCYVAKTGDAAWARRNRHVLAACLDSLDARRDSGPGGWMTRDSARCGRGGEITTYDSLDESLGQARANLYVAVKRWAAYGALRLVAQAADLGGDLADRCGAEMAAFAEGLARVADDSGGVLPAVLEPGNPGHASRILCACEPLIYPWYWSACGHDFDLGVPETWAVVDVLRDHVAALLGDPDGRNRFEDGGIRLSSTSNNSWMSKIALAQQVVRRVLRQGDDSAVDDLMRDADAAHVGWQSRGSAYWACCDQIVSGIARGSRYYPRVITTALWMHEHDVPARRSDAAQARTA